MGERPSSNAQATQPPLAKRTWKLNTPSAGSIDKEMSDDSLSKRLVARLGGALAAAAGLAVLVGLPLLSEPGPRRWVLAGTGTIAFVGSVVTWHLPWERWSTSASLWLAPIGFLLVAISDIAALPEMPFMYSIFYLAIFGWIGLGHR